MSNDDWKERELGALWLKESGQGQKFYSGKVTVNGEEVQIVCFKNKFKEKGDNKPDLRVYLSEDNG